MESGQLKLDDCVAQFERGAKLAGWCTARLAETEKKIEVLLAGSQGDPQWRPLDNEG
jgi:exodeoxyribonuclease VII small subunit